MAWQRYWKNSYYNVEIKKDVDFDILTFLGVARHQGRYRAVGCARHPGHIVVQGKGVLVQIIVYNMSGCSLKWERLK